MFLLRRLLVSLGAFCALAFIAATAKADPITIVGVGSGGLATASVDCVFNAQTNTLTFTILNTSPSTAAITGIGFDLPPLGNGAASGLNGFTGSQAPSLTSTFTFSDGDLGNVPHGFNSAVLDFGFITGPSGNFAGGQVALGLLPGESGSFTVSGAGFAGLTEEEICNAIFVRFQNVPAPFNSDVGVPTQVPEPSTMLLLGTALVGVGGVVRKKLHKKQDHR
jgi:hypothetical protein